MPLVSVVIPVYNRAHTLERAVRSVLQQSMADLEVLVVDDGSTDESTLLANRLADEDKRVLPLSLSGNHGVAFARNRGIEKAQGRYLALLDSDDQWRADKLEQQLSFLQSLSCPAVCHCEEIWFRGGVRVNPRRKHSKPDGWVFPACLPRCVIAPSSVLAEKDVLTACGLFDEDLAVCEDYDLWVRLSLRFPFALLRTGLVTRFGGHADQLSRLFWGLERFHIISLLKLLDSPRPDHEQRALVRHTIAHKAHILARGFRKRGKSFQATLYHKLAQLYQEQNTP